MAGRFFIGILALSGLFSLGCAPEPGLTERGLAPCPDRPNCVSSQATDEKQATPPLTYGGSRQAAMERLVVLVSELPRTKIITRTTDYLHVEFRSKWFRFVDDVEFWLPPDEPGALHIRSASRLGYSDMGVNRKRVENIRELFSTRTP